MTIESNKGPSVRVTALKVGTDYVMATWTKPAKTLDLVTFLGYNSSFQPVETIPQLKTLTENSKFYFKKGDDVVMADGRNAGALFIGEDAGHRVTFFEVVGTYEDIAGGALDSPLTDTVENVKELIEA